MREQLVSGLIWLIILVPIGLFVRQLGQVRRGAVRKLSGVLRFFGYSIIPVLLSALLFFAMIGIEEITKWSNVTN
jgi:hypothetical protein